MGNPRPPLGKPHILISIGIEPLPPGPETLNHEPQTLNLKRETRDLKP